VPRGLAYGVTASASFLGSFLGPFTGGLLAAIAGTRVVFILITALFALNFMWVYRTVPEIKGTDGKALAGR